MKRSNPSTVVGGGEMNRATSSVVSSAQSDVASDARISRNTTCVPRSVGRPCCQSLLTIGAAASCTGMTARCTGMTAAEGCTGMTSSSAR